MVVALFAALIVPWFVNWNDYRASFEAEASRILGHRVHVEGDAHAIILPSPSLTFTKVEVDDESGQRIMDVGRFDVVIELMPLLQGEIRVVSMTLEKPVVNVAIDVAGKVAWLNRAKLREPFDPDKVVLDNITIKDGALNYSDAQSGVALSFDGISAQVTARALTGPWHVDGFYLDNGSQVGFRISTGRVLDDGTIRIKADVNPARWPVTVGVDGPIGLDPAEGLMWRGTYSVSQVAIDDSGSGDAANESTGWRSEGAFTLTGDRLDISKAVLSSGPVDRPFSLAGTLTLNFGMAPSFAATAEARQIDLDRTLGQGPSQPVDVSAAADSLVAWLSQLPVPDMPGSISLRVPTIVVGGRIIEDVGFTAAPATGGWQIGSLSARLPGQARIEASGLMSTRQKFGFVGQARLAVAQPATFATWWRGGGQEGAGRLLAPFDLAGHAAIAPGRVSLDHATVHIDKATISGKFEWGEAAKDHRRKLGAVVDASGLIDFVQLKALAELLVGRNLTNAGTLADDYSLQVAADAFAFQDLTVKGIQVNAEYGNDALRVTKLQVDDIAGARIERTFGEIDNLSGDPRGHLDTTLHAPTLTGLARLADRFLPKSGFTHWLDAAAPSLGAAVMTAKIAAPLPDGSSGFAFTVDNGVAASTTVSNLSASFTGGFAHWRSKPAEIKVQLFSPDSAELARQFGLAAVTLDKDDGARIQVQAKGVPSDGLDTMVMADLAGLSVTARGSLRIGEDLAPSFAGAIDASSDNIDPIVAMAGLAIPSAVTGTALWLDKAPLTVSDQGLDLAFKNGKIGPAIASGDVMLAPDDANGWEIGGTLVADQIDLGWVASLGLGVAPAPTGDLTEPWSRAPFGAPAYGLVSGKLQVAADRLDVGDLGLTGTQFTLALRSQRIDLDLTQGQLNGGTVTGGMSIHNVGGNTALAGRFDLKGATLDSFVWRRDGRTVATGTIDLSANFESTGRSPAGLVSTMTGGGVLTVHDGLARYVNPDAVRRIVRESDLGQEFSEDALRAAFSAGIEADNMAFGDASGAFSIVAGAVRLNNLVAKTSGLAAKGNTTIDFNAMTLDSDWDLSFDPVDNKVLNRAPEAGLVFRGPLTEPSRSIDVVQFASYLNEREAARMSEIIALTEASRAEKQRLDRLVVKLKEDADRRAADARIAAEREAQRRAVAQARAATLEAFHVDREVLLERRRIEGLTALAERLAVQQRDAKATADEAARAAFQARVAADAAGQALADARAVDEVAVVKAANAAAELATANAAADAAAQDAAQSADAADRTNLALATAAAEEADARAAAEKALQAKADADKALKAANLRDTAAATAADKADAAAASAAADRAAAETAATDARDARDAAKAALAKVEVQLRDAQAAADVAASKATTLGGGESAAEAAKAKADADARAAADALTAGLAARDGASAKRDAAKADTEAAVKSAAERAAQAKQAADLAQALAASDESDAQAVVTAQAMRAAADGAAQQAAAKQAAADAASKALADAQAAFDRAAAAVAAAEKQQQDATAVATAADAAVRNAMAEARRAVLDKTAAQAGLDRAVSARDAAKALLAEKELAVERTAAEAAAAVQADGEAVAAAAQAKAEAKAARAARTVAENTAAERAAAVSQTAKAADAAAAKGSAAAADAKAATAKAATAANNSAAAAKALAARTAAHDDAEATAASAAAAREEAEATAAKAAARAETAEAAAQAAAAQADDAVAAAEAAREAADRAAENAADVVAAEPVTIVPVAVPR